MRTGQVAWSLNSW